jgi:phosphoserine aminotransferase
VVDCIVFDTFIKKWHNDIKNRLKIQDCRDFSAEYGDFPDISKIDNNRDIVFCYNGTTSGTHIDNFDFIKKDRTGLTFCDATSSVFAYDVDWSKIDVLTYSWQKVLGGEAAHGVIVMGPRAIERLNNYTPDRPIPTFMDLRHKDIFTEGLTINTLSMLCVADCRDALEWAKGVDLQKKTEENSGYLYDFIDKNPHFKPLVKLPQYRSKTAVAFIIENVDKIQKIVDLLAEENVAFDIKGHRDAPPSFRVWCGPTVALEDIKILCEWLEWAVNNV